MKVFIVNPSNASLVPVEDWKRVEDPKAANLVAISYDNGNILYISKNRSKKEMPWPDAMKYAEGFKSPEVSLSFRAPTRRESLDMADAKDLGIMDALELIGGNALDSGGYWTCERISHWLAARCNVDSAWFYLGYNGYIDHGNFYRGFTVVPVALYTPSESEA